MNQFYGFRFDDCILVDFSIDKALQSCYLLIEAYLPRLSEISIVRIECVDLIKFSLSVTKGFWEDLSRNYARGDDYKANEIYSISTDDENNGIKFTFTSDMLQLSIVCEEVKITDSDLISQ